MKRILFITNGHGEDLVAAEIIKKIKKNSDFQIHVLPFVGEGNVFNNLGVVILGQRKKLPSGGFSLRNLWFLLKDISAGLLGQTRQAITLLKEQRDKTDLVIAIGDIVPIIGALLTKTPFFFIGVNKSDHYQQFGFRYTPWEKWLLEKYALKVYVRDSATKCPKGEYVGNPLMDCISSPPNPLSIKDGEGDIRFAQSGVRIGFLPGTRDDAKLNIADFEKIAHELKVNIHNPHFIIATKEETPSIFQAVPFDQLLRESTIVVGLSGTGNEQAAGLGNPVVSFYGRGSQYNKKFARAQKELLGEALLLVKTKEEAAKEIVRLVKDKPRLEVMAEIGRERMGKAGATEIISQEIIQRFK
ncbi:MAG: hypothetical protein ABIE84_05755 [bacterium]